MQRSRGHHGNAHFRPRGRPQRPPNIIIASDLESIMMLLSWQLWRLLLSLSLERLLPPFVGTVLRWPTRGAWRRGRKVEGVGMDRGQVGFGDTWLRWGRRKSLTSITAVAISSSLPNDFVTLASSSQHSLKPGKMNLSLVIFGSALSSCY